MIFGFAILATAILLSCVAAYYSVAGLTAIFSAATIPVIIMGGSLELGKIVATVWLHNNWRRAPFLFKAYLVPAVAFLMLLTSMGIFGYLSKAHSDQSLVSGDAVAKVAIYDEKISTAKENIATNRKALKQMDEAVDQVMGRSDDEKGADKAVAIRRGQAKERARLLAEIEVEQKKVSQLSEERAPLAAEFRKVESEVGPIKYIAALVYGDNPDANVLERAVRLVIIMIVLVFDPLALTLILAANKQFEWAMHGRGGWVHDEDDEFQKALDKKRQVAQALDSGGELPPEDTTVVESQDPHPVGWMFDKFPYLKNGAAMFFKDTKPIVATNSEPEQNTVSEAVVQPNLETASIPDVERPGDYVSQPVWQEAEVTTEEDENDENAPALRAAKVKWKSLNPNRTLKEQRLKLARGEIEELPWITMMRESNNTFGSTFPLAPKRGDKFLKTDRIPSILYKFNGDDWIEVDKSQADDYTYDTAYVDHLISKIETGEYDPDLLSENEREQVALRLTQTSPNT